MNFKLCVNLKYKTFRSKCLRKLVKRYTGSKFSNSKVRGRTHTEFYATRIYHKENHFIVLLLDMIKFH